MEEKILTKENPTTKLSQEIIKQLRDIYGNMVDGIRIRKINDDTYEISVIFYQRFRQSKLDNETSKLARQSTAYDLCNVIERMVLNRVPNRTIQQNQHIPDMKFHVNRNVPDGMIFISPKTYYEMINKLNEVIK